MGDPLPPPPTADVTYGSPLSDAALAMAVGSFFIPLSSSSAVQSLYLQQQQPLRRRRRLPSSAIRLLNEKIMKCWEGGTEGGRVQE